MKPYLIFIGVVAASLFGCRDYGIVPTKTQTVYPDLSSTDFYDCVIHDSLGSISATGKLALSIAHFRVTGSWSLNDGRSGRLNGTMDNRRMEFDLYPDSDAYDLILTVELPFSILEGFSGAWKLDSLGIHQHGQFDATYTGSVILE